jgi:H+/Cl- antiporter ClcA
MDYLSVGLILFFIVIGVFNIFAIISADYKEWFNEFREYNICEFILLLTLLLPTTILFALIYILSIKPFSGKDV